MSHNPPNLSLVIPTYNRGSLIGPTIDSAVNQSLPYLEIIVVDDGSTDNTSKVLEQYTGKIRVIKLSNGGVQRARNMGASAAKGDFVVFCDSDDLLEPNHSQVVTSWLDANPDYDAVYSNFLIFDDQGIRGNKFALAPPSFFDQAIQSESFWHDIPDLYVKTVAYQPLFPSGSVIRKTLYEEMGGYDERFNGVGAEDWEFTLRLIGRARLALCSIPLVRIRKHAGNDSADNIRTVSGCVHILEFALREHPFSTPYRDVILRSIDERRLGVFNGAFADGLFDIAKDMLRSMRQRPRDSKFFLKTFIVALPAPLRRPLWLLSQRM